MTKRFIDAVKKCVEDGKLSTEERELLKKVAKEEGHGDIARMLDMIGKIEIEHENMYKSLKHRLDSGKEHVSDEEEEWICEVCGHVHRGKKALKVCPVCKHPLEYQSRLNAKK